MLHGRASLLSALLLLGALGLVSSCSTHAWLAPVAAAAHAELSGQRPASQLSGLSSSTRSSSGAHFPTKLCIKSAAGPKLVLQAPGRWGSAATHLHLTGQKAGSNR